MRSFTSASKRLSIKQVSRIMLLGLLTVVLDSPLVASFNDPFSSDDTLHINAWRAFSGDGNATIAIQQGDGFLEVEVDATEDIYNVWWAIINRSVTDHLDLEQLAKPGYELRMEAKIRSSHAPRRVNLSFNTQRTTDYHSHLMEYDIPEPDTWRVISLTTRDFDGQPGDQINCQMALMDWGLESYQVDVDYVKVEVVRGIESTNDLGEPIPYHPPAPSPSSFTHILACASAATIDSTHPDRIFSHQSQSVVESKQEVLSVGGSQVTLLNWKFQDLHDYKVSGPAVLELTTSSVSYPEQKQDDIGLLRVSELYSKSIWTEATASWNQIHQGQSTAQIINPQMIIDHAIAPTTGDTNFIVLSQPAVRRLLNESSSGIALSPLGDIHAEFFGTHGPEAFQPKLYLNLEKQ